ncbi:uncharacterized protein LOC129124059 [Agelaius phoeniceus]|uniref:uncharacterized protein LOC129124059 n=1 Tax=Agelaius phoeniceus TaxID=39638 RepID=UPI004054B94D
MRVGERAAPCAGKAEPRPGEQGRGRARIPAGSGELAAGTAAGTAAGPRARHWGTSRAPDARVPPRRGVRQLPWRRRLIATARGQRGTRGGPGKDTGPREGHRAAGRTPGAREGHRERGTDTGPREGHRAPGRTPGRGTDPPWRHRRLPSRPPGGAAPARPARPRCARAARPSARPGPARRHRSHRKHRSNYRKHREGARDVSEQKPEGASSNPPQPGEAVAKQSYPDNKPPRPNPQCSLAGSE